MNIYFREGFKAIPFQICDGEISVALHEDSSFIIGEIENGIISLSTNTDSKLKNTDIIELRLEDFCDELEINRDYKSISEEWKIDNCCLGVFEFDSKKLIFPLHISIEELMGLGTIKYIIENRNMIHDCNIPLLDFTTHSILRDVKILQIIE